MRAVVLRAFGPPEVLAAEEVADPVAGHGQVLIEVTAASVVFVETQVRAGNAPTPAHRPPLPLIPGNGVGGVIRAVGPGVDSGLLGTRVVSTTGGRGGYAELVAVDAGEPIAVPDGLGTEVATALLADGSIEQSPRELTSIALAEAAAGRLRPMIGQSFPLEDAAAAHAAIEQRATVGKTLLIPGHSR